MSKRRTVLITGCSRGIGLQIAKLFASKDGDWNVVATMRTPSCEAGLQLESLPNVTVLPLDVTSKASVDAAIAQVPGGIDVLINNAGYALVGALELATEDQIKNQFNTNVFGCIRTMQAVLPAMRKRRSGVIVQISSAAGKITMPFSSSYHATKFALEGLSESCAMELMPFNIKMRIVEPGFVTTDFANVMQFTNEGNGTGTKEYEALEKRFFQNFQQLMSRPSTPEKVAQVVYDAATSDGDKLRWAVGEDAIESIKNRPGISDEEHIKGFVGDMRL